MANTETLPPLHTVFGEEHFAWQLLECQVQMEVCPQLDGKDIAKLLSLYMRGVQKLNSIQDKRQSFFKNRVTSLMMKPNVVKSLSSPPKQKAPNPVASPQRPADSNNQTQLTPTTPSSPEVSMPNLTPSTHTIAETDPELYNELMKKRKEMEMRITYQAEEHTPQAMSKLVSQHHVKASTLMGKMQQLKAEQEKRLEDRIKTRKLKTLSARSTSQHKAGSPAEAKKESLKHKLMTVQAIKEEETEQYGTSNTNNLVTTHPKKRNPSVNRSRRLSRKYSMQLLPTRADPGQKVAGEFKSDGVIPGTADTPKRRNSFYFNSPKEPLKLH